MAIFGWPGGFDPWGGLRYVSRELERLVGRSPQDARQVGGGIYPPVNVLDGPDDILVQCEVAGVPQADLDISITGETLVVKGVKRLPPAEDKLTYQRRERGAGEFSRTVILPDKVDPDRVEAKLVNGLLEIRLPKSDAARPKRIQVK